MKKVVLVDDEEYVIQGLINCIDWSSIDISIAGTATNGIQALEIIKKEKPDIIITDIYMPQMDGLELIEKTLAILPHAKTIILSGYEEFEYAQTAIRNKAYDYILKPVEVEEMEEIIKKAKKKIDQEMSRINNEKQLKKQLRESLPVLKEKYLHYLLTNTLSWNIIKRRFDYLNFNIVDKNVIALVMKIKEVGCIDGERQQLIVFSIKEKILEQFHKKYQVEVMDEYSNTLTIILNYPDQRQMSIVQDIHDICSMIKEEIKSSFRYDISMGIGRPYKTIDYISESYKEAREALNNCIFLQDEEILYFGDIDIKTDIQPISYPVNIEEKIIMALKIGDVENTRTGIKEFIDFYLKNKNISPERLKRGCLQLVFIILRDLVELKTSIKNMDISKNIIEDTINKSSSWQQLENNMISFIENIAESIKTKKNDQKQLQLKRVCNFIKENYHKDLSLNDIASSIHLTKNYFANLFKEETGKTVMEHLTDIRMQKARSLLKNTDLKIYEITKKVGYNNYNYFACVFKKMNGCSPNEYRNNF